ncbi:CxC ATPase DNA modification system associated small protein [Photobacterium damselae]|uniref:Uncharacterized protein n=2 Tax=Photobacterium TaxID=657 RepID=A0ABD6X348_PHODM|nr:CxC ATPase DNA modification system associated small protein [Photobacterium damselae]KAB1516092.1 hypothetical protein FD717_007430 [Photobacterium damselae subsp. damselae]OBU40710.1 hypothetical protein AYY27_08710 [Photobacterium damselae]PSU16715.1 hypothetical protein CTM90_11590 [Photobacterium damselae]
MSLAAFKALLKQIDIETEEAHNNYSERSAVHCAALQIMQFEKDLYYGEAVNGKHLKKIQSIIEIHLEDIINETTKNKN